MIVFIVPIMSAKSANSWDKVCKLLERCIRSIFNQTSPKFRVIVVCHEEPKVEFKHHNLVYHKVDFELPGSDIKSRMLDRGRKVLTGLIRAQEFAPTHVMVVDGDDCVSRRLAEFIEQNPNADGWFIDRGYIYKERSQIIFLKNRGFYNICGTCNIIKYELYEIIQDSQPNLGFILDYHGNHKYILKRLTEKGALLKPLPFIGAIYTVENGENYYNPSFKNLVVPRKWLSRLRALKNYRLLTSAICQEFGLHQLP